LIGAWEDIASGDPNRIKRAALVVTAREQDPVLQPHYDRWLRDAPGLAFQTSEKAKPPVPDGIAFADVSGNGPCIPISVNEYTTPTSCLPRSFHVGRGPTITMSVAYWEDRQRWVFGDMLPRVQQWLDTDPQALRDEVAKSLDDRANPYHNAPI